MKEILGSELSDDVLKLAVKKCNLILDEAVMHLTLEENVIDLQEELRKQSENNNNIAILDLPKEEEAEPGKVEEAKLNLIISNRVEYFELLFELLNLGVNEITNAAWRLLV